MVSHPLVLLRIPLAFDRENWVPIRLHEISADIADKAGEGSRLLTLAPLLALEGGCDIYREFSAGPFVYRISHLMSPEDIELIHTAGPKELAQLVATSPPAAVILGLEWQSLEEDLYKTAVGPGWQKQVYGDTGVVVYFRP